MNIFWETWQKLFIALEGQEDECLYLLSEGADVNIADNDGFTPLFVAAR